MKVKTEDPKPEDKEPQGGNPNPEGGNPSPGDNLINENIKNLQRKLSEKDLALREAHVNLDKLTKKTEDEKFDFSKIVETFNEKIGELSGQLKGLEREKRIKDLEKKYPDVLPELLIDKEEDEIKKFVEKQRAVNKKLYGDSQVFITPVYNSTSDVDKEMKAIEEDKKVSGENAAFRMLRLTREKLKF